MGEEVLGGLGGDVGHVICLGSNSQLTSHSLGEKEEEIFDSATIYIGRVL